MKKQIATLLLVPMLLIGVFTTMSVNATGEDEVVIIHTNDVHCNIDSGVGYSGVAAYVAEMESIYGEDYVTLVDAGDAVQGGAVGKLSEGEAIIEIMNEVGYDIFTLGNHEFDYGVSRMFELVEMLDATVISSNFMDLTTGESVYEPYTIVDYGDFQVAFVGIATPDTVTKSSPTNFQDENGEFIYGFCEGEDGEVLYANVQESVDDAIAEGADYVIALGHMGIEESSSPYMSTEIIANTTGIDVFLDGHSHSVIPGEEVENEAGEIVLLNQTGTKLENIGKITINNTTGEIVAELISEEDYTEKDADVQAFIDEINAENAVLLEEVIITTEFAMNINTPGTEDEIVRSQETNLGDFCADAYRYVLETDIALINGGGIRADIEAGEITYGDVIEVHPWGNDAMSVEVSGQVILDALEMGAKDYPSNSGGFLQVSGLTYKIDPTVESTIVTDELGVFIEVAGEYRVYDVMVGDEPLDLDKMYSVASHNYLLQNQGDGMSMFDDATVIKDMYMIDNEVLMTYMQEVGVGEEYADMDGQGRIVVEEQVIELAEETLESETILEETSESETILEETEESTDSVMNNNILVIITSAIAVAVIYIVKWKKKKTS